MSATTALGINLVERLRDGDLPRVLALGLRHYLLYVACREDLPYWVGIATELKRAIPDARIHVRLEARGALDVGGDLAFLGATDRAFGALADTLRIRNEPNIESPGVTPAQWRDYLVELGHLFHRNWSGRLYTPAPSPTGDWTEWLWRSGDAAEAGAVDGLDLHAYGSPSEVVEILAQFDERWAGAPLVTEYNFGAGREVDLSDYALDIPVVLSVAGDYHAEAVCLFAWRWSAPDLWLPTTVNVADTMLEQAIPRIVAGQGPGGGDDVTMTELDRYVADLYHRFAVPYNPDAAFTKYFVAELKADRFLGAPLESEHQTEDGLYVMQAFANTILHCKVGEWIVQVGLPPNLLPST